MLKVLIMIFFIFLTLLLHTYSHFSDSLIVTSRFTTLSTKKNLFMCLPRTSIPSYQYQQTIQSWSNLNPNYTQHLWDDGMCDRFMKIHYPGDVYQAYQKLVPMAYKMDLWRLCVLDTFGGVYVDAYAKPFVSLDDMLEDYSEIFVSVLDSPKSGLGVHNGFICAKAGHLYLKQGITEIVGNVQREYYGDGPLDPTGPKCLEKAMRSLIKPDSGVSSYQFKPGYNSCIYTHRPDSSDPFFLFELSYGPYQNVYKGKKKVFCKYFSFLFYLYWKTLRKSTYGSLWKERRIYKR